jgi:hypothetical protein
MTDGAGAVTAPQTAMAACIGAVAAPQTAMTAGIGAVAAPQSAMTAGMGAIAAPWTAMTAGIGAVTAPWTAMAACIGAVTVRRIGIVKDSSRLTRLTVVAGFFWLTILIGITLIDYLRAPAKRFQALPQPWL